MHSGHVPSFLCVMYLRAKFCSFLFTFSFEMKCRGRKACHARLRTERERGKKWRNLHKGESITMFYERYLLGNNSIIMRDTKIAVLWKLKFLIIDKRNELWFLWFIGIKLLKIINSCMFVTMFAYFARLLAQYTSSA